MQPIYLSLWWLSLTFLWCNVLQSQETPLADRLDSTVIISHSRIPIDLKKTIKPAIIISRAEINKSGANDLSQILANIPGIIANGSYSNPSLNKNIYLQGALATYTLILVDGVPIIDPSGIGGSFDIRNFAASQINRIEIIKGGHSTLYGSDAVAGVINIITTQSAPSTDVQLSFGSLGQFSSNIKTAGQTDHLSYSAGVSYEQSRGMSEAEDISRPSTFDNDGYERFNAFADAKWKINEQVNFKPYVKYTIFNGDYDGGSFTDSPDTYESNWLNSGGAINLNTDKLKGYLNYSFNQIDRKFISNQFGPSLLGGKMQNLDLFLSYSANRQFTISGGFQAQNHSSIPSNTSLASSSATLLSPYLSTLSSFGNFNIEAGLRYNHHSTFGNKFNYSIGANYLLNNAWKPYISFSTSFKSPNLFQLFGQFGANPQLQPETGKSLQAGLEGSWNKTNATIGYFHRVINEVIVYDFSSGYQNLSTQLMEGLELSVNQRLSEIVGITASYQVFLNDFSVTNSPPLRIPKHHLKAAINVNLKNGLYVSVLADRMGKRDDAYFDNNTFETKIVSLDRYLLFNLNAKYQFQKIPLSAFVSMINIFDTDFTEIIGFNTLGRNLQFGLKYSL